MSYTIGAQHKFSYADLNKNFKLLKSQYRATSRIWGK